MNDDYLERLLDEHRRINERELEEMRFEQRAALIVGTVAFVIGDVLANWLIGVLT